jgi:long-chain acyl-CoA synthetase
MGPPNMPNVDVRLEFLPKFNYDAFNYDNTTNPQGGICIHGSFLFSSYYKHEGLIKKVLVDGWIHIGN